MLLIIDNFDSFTYNIVQYCGELGAQMLIKRNDAMTIDEIEQLNPAKILISPGPGAPEQAGVSLQVIQHFYDKKPILGVCLGHQCLAQAFGAKIIHANTIIHGKTSFIHHNNQGLFVNIKEPFAATRYHSLVVDKHSLPDCFDITAWTLSEITAQKEAVDEIMAIQHKHLPLYGVQFHPESILTESGMQIIKNFLEL